MSENESNPRPNVEPTVMNDDAVYRENVNRLMASGSAELISNGLPRHAAVLFECFFRNAASEVKIFCRNLQSDVFDTPEVISSFASAARRGVSVQIVVQENHDPASVFAKVLQEMAEADHGNLCLQTEASAKSTVIASRGENFAVMDRKAFRYEVDSLKCEAVASMNQPSIASRLCQVFDRLYTSLRKPDLVTA